jgi:hypothetical protein
MSAIPSLPRKNLVIVVRTCILSLAGALLLSVVPAVATAKPGCGAGLNVPSGSEIDQYAQSIPGACGNQEQGGPQTAGGGSSGGGGGSGSSGAPISASTRELLQDQGAAGAVAESLANANAPRIRNNGGGGSAGGQGKGSGSDDGQSQAGAALDSLLGSDDGGMGIVLPLILLGVAVGGGLFVTRRARQAG